MTGNALGLDWWRGRISRPKSTDLTALPIVAAKLRQATTGCAPFQAPLQDGRVVWVKAMGNPQGNQALTTEFVVASVGRLLGLSVAEPIIVHLPAVLAGMVRDHPEAPILQSGPAFASAHIADAEEKYEFTAAHKDDNPRRHVGIWALWELFLGDDAQWIYSMSDDESTYSFDHSLWLGRHEADWDRQFLTQEVHSAWETFTTDTSYFDPTEVRRIAQALRGLTPEEILEILLQVPVEWGTSTSDLEALGWFLAARRFHVADHLDALNP